MVKRHTAGESVYDENLNLLRWNFRNESFKKEINYRVELFDECEDIRPISINFYIKEASKAGVNLEKAECIDNPGVYFWMSYSICNGRYEMRI